MDYKKLLDRDEQLLIDIDIDKLIDKKILITGAAGTIGWELARYLLGKNITNLALIDRSENGIYELDKKIKYSGFENKKTELILLDVQHCAMTRRVINRVSPDIIIHCAAHKYVNITENNIIETIRNNVFGTENILTASDTAKFILVSTDKAVEPISIYGCSKLIAEEMIIKKQKEDGTGKYKICRFCNILASTGSVLPYFVEQYSRLGYITITDKSMERFFITAEEAISLILKSIYMYNGYNVLLYKIQKASVIEELAIKMMGKDTPIKYIGQYPAEKLKEKLYTEQDQIIEIDNSTIGINYNKSRIDNIENVIIKLSKIIYDGSIKKSEKSQIEEIMKIIKKGVMGK